MSLFDRMAEQGSMSGKLQQLKMNPGQMLRQAGLNVPGNITNNPQAMVQHLIQTGQVSNPVLQRVMPMIRQLTGK